MTVITPVRNEARVLADTAGTIFGQQFDGSIEFLLVEGGSTDGTRAMLQKLAENDHRIRILDNPKGDLASALQIGLREARGEFIAKMDAHSWFRPDYLQNGVDRLRRGDVNWVSGPPIPTGVDAGSRRVAIALGTKLGVGGSAKWPVSLRGDGSGAETELDTGVFSGVWTRSSLERLGGWDSGWPSNEDAELAGRFQASGERVLCLPSMGARYLPRSTVSGVARQYFRYGHYRVKTAVRHPASLRRSALLPPGLVLSLALGALGRRGRVAAGLASAVYASALVTTSARLAPEVGARDASHLPLVFAAMHLGYGAGMVSGAVRFGVPVAAVKNAIAGGAS